MHPLAAFGLVFLGGGTGSALRYATSFAFAKSPFPLTTLIVNLIGSALIGAAMGKWEGDLAREPLRLVFVVGVLGGFTTFSAFSYEQWTFIRQGQWGGALGSMAVQCVGGIGLAALGYALTHRSA